MKVFKDMHEHILKHPHKYLGLAVFCKVMLVGLLAIPVLQILQNVYAAGWTITATAGMNGNITPSGRVAVEDGGNQEFIITPDTTYGVSDVLIDGSSTGQVSRYIFTGVGTDHTIHTTFDVLPNAINKTVDCGLGGKIGGGRGLVFTFDRQINDIFPLENFTIGGVYYTVTPSTTPGRDGVPPVPPVYKVSIDLGSSFPEGNFTLDIARDTNRNGILDTVAHAAPFTVDCIANSLTVTAGANGTTKPAPETYRTLQGDNMNIQFIPIDGYKVGSVTVDGIVITPTPTSDYTVKNITKTSTLDVQFEQITSTPPTGGGSRSRDNCQAGSNIPGARDGTDRSKDQRGNINYYDKKCRSPEEEKCATEGIATCLGLNGMVEKLKALNDSFSIFGTSRTSEPITMETTDLRTLLAYMAKQLQGLNNKLKDISKTNTMKVNIKNQTQQATFGEKIITPTNGTSTLLEVLSNMQKNLEGLNDNLSAAAGSGSHSIGLRHNF